MFKKWLMTGLAVMAFNAHAGSIELFDLQFDVTAIAITDGTPGFDSQSSPPGTAPVVASTDSTWLADIATAGSFGGAGLLFATADASAVGGVTSAVATSHFAASFVNQGPLVLSFDFITNLAASGTGLATSTLFVTLTTAGTTVFQDYITGTQQLVFEFTPGSTSVLDLMLSSEASAAFPLVGPGDAAAFGQVAFAAAVPTPASSLMLASGLILIAVYRRRVTATCAGVA